MAEDKLVYTINFKCQNCTHIFARELKMGTTAEGAAGKCPHCGCTEDTVVSATGQKLGRFEVIPTTENLEKLKKVELLLERKHERS